MIADAFLVGFIFACCLVASTFFIKFWLTTKDKLFLAFAIVFVIEGISRVLSITIANPSEGAPFIYLMRLIAYLVIIVAIAAKNRRPNAR
jgi:hypothetical protein